MRQLLGLVVVLAGQTHVDSFFVATDFEQDICGRLLLVEIDESAGHFEGDFHVAIRQVVAGDLNRSLPDL